MYDIYGIDKRFPLGVCVTKREAKEFVNKHIAMRKEAAK